MQIHCAVGFLWDFHLNSFCLEGIPKFPKEEPTPIVVQEGEPIVLHCNPPKGVAPRLLYWMSIGKPSVYAWGLCGWSTCWLVSGSTEDFRNVDCNGKHESSLKVKQNKFQIPLVVSCSVDQKSCLQVSSNSKYTQLFAHIKSMAVSDVAFSN